MRKGFTLIELIIVIIIVGILATIGISQYTKVVEKGRAAEARQVLGALRTAQAANLLENNSYTSDMDLLGVGAPAACDTNHYFSYGCTAAGLCTATRCTSGGKTPNFTPAASAYTISLTTDTGVWTNASGY